LTVHGMCQICAARRSSRSQRPAARRLPKDGPRPGKRTVRDDA
jgi:hypothetical protein